MNFRRRPEVTPLEDRVVPTPVITVAALADATEGGSAGTFRVSRSEGTSSLSLTFNVQGTAELYTDHGDAEAPYQIVFGLGPSSVDVTIGATDDTTSEPTETVTLNILSGTGYTVGDPLRRRSTSSTTTPSPSPSPRWRKPPRTGTPGYSGSPGSAT